MREDQAALISMLQFTEPITRIFRQHSAMTLHPTVPIMRQTVQQREEMQRHWSRQGREHRQRLSVVPAQRSLIREPSRATNIAVAASRINGVVIQPGEEFSFNRTILPRTAANGYVEAPIYVSGKHSTGTGGGICQVSSTMYSAMLNGGIPATERHPHSLPVPYLPEGRDATIAGNYYDLRFVNIYNTPLQISAVADLRTGTVSVTLIQQ